MRDPADRNELIKTAKSVMRRLRDADDLDVHEEPKVGTAAAQGWFAEIGRTVAADLPVEIWFDRYLDIEAPEPRYSIWVFADSVGRLRGLSEKSRWPQEDERVRPHRTKDRFLTLKAAPGDAWLGRAFLDSWSGFGQYFGRYTKATGRRAIADALAADALEMARLLRPRADRTISKTASDRRGQAAFKKELMEHFGGRCVISGCALEILLDAAHIEPYARGKHYGVRNGLLLRKDLHALFDARLLDIRSNGKAYFAPRVRKDPHYRELHGKRVSNLRPEHRALLKKRRDDGDSQPSAVSRKVTPRGD